MLLRKQNRQAECRTERGWNLSDQTSHKGGCCAHVETNRSSGHSKSQRASKASHGVPVRTPTQTTDVKAQPRRQGQPGCSADSELTEPTFQRTANAKTEQSRVTGTHPDILTPRLPVDSRHVHISGAHRPRPADNLFLYSLQAKNGSYIFQGLKKQRICKRDHTRPTKPKGLLFSPLYEVCRFVLGTCKAPVSEHSCLSLAAAHQTKALRVNCFFGTRN